MVKAIELLDRQYERVSAAQGPVFLQELKRYRDLLDEDPDLERFVGEANADAEAAREAFVAHDDALVDALAEFKATLVDRAPELDDSDADRPQGPAASTQFTWMHTFANFDLVVSRDEKAVSRTRDFDDSRSGLLLAILTEKIHTAQWRIQGGPVVEIADTNQRPDLDDLAIELGNLGDRHRHAFATYEQAIAQIGGFALVHIDTVLAEANPPPRQVAGEAEWHDHIDQTFKKVLAGLHVVPAAMGPRADQDLSTQDRQVVDELVKRLRPNVDRLHEDIRLRLARSPEPPADYWTRVERWVKSASGQLFVVPLASAALVQLVKSEGEGLLLLIALGVAATLLPPAASADLFPRANSTRYTTFFILLATTVIVIAMAAIGLGAGLLAFVAMAAAFWLGAQVERSP